MVQLELVQLCKWKQIFFSVFTLDTKGASFTYTHTKNLILTSIPIIILFLFLFRRHGLLPFAQLLLLHDAVDRI